MQGKCEKKIEFAIYLHYFKRKFGKFLYKKYIICYNYIIMRAFAQGGEKMIFQISDRLGYKKVLALLTVFVIAFGALLSFFGEIFLPFTVATFAALALFENNKNKKLLFIKID